ncbi:MAG: DUF1488 family protein [Pseudomonadota bacterium]
MFVFPDDAIWDEAREAVVFTVELGEYRGSCVVPRRVFHDLLGRRPTAEECVQHFHLARTEFERIVEHKLVARELEDDASLRISMRDLRRFRGP